ncbi:MAG: hypothetical protein J1F03_09580 [Oscillospiraceae bacterium]|nr:hypothetical protein [Oscillospiraceae bacterium]
MAKESLIMKALREDYVSMSLDIENTCKKTDILLKIYRKVSWSAKESFDELNEITYESCMSATEHLCYLLNFAPDKELGVFERRAVSAMQTRVLVELIERAAVKLKEYPDNGSVYYSIIELKYLGYFHYTEGEILEQLNMERSNYYRKHREAKMLMGYVLFGLIMPDYVNEKQQSGATKMRLSCD